MLLAGCNDAQQYHVWTAYVFLGSNYEFLCAAAKPTNEAIIIQTVRIPRALIAGLVGGSLGLLRSMQAITRNLLASPSMFGINSGAAFAIVLSVGFFNVSSLTQFTWIAFLGAAFSSALVYGLGSLGRDGLTPMKITLAGSAMTAFFASLTQGILLGNGKAFDQVLYWLVGSVEGRTMAMLQSVYPYILIAWIGAIFLSPHINILSMGDDVAKGLGQRTIYVKFITAVVIVILAGGSVAVAGPIVFVGYHSAYRSLSCWNRLSLGHSVLCGTRRHSFSWS